ncbi:hypothetical protein NIES592_14640 [Fischerella major NIES-592]|uniref:PIN domain-containing protein n=1 Tax=Fischerella major NIES-592 TaxID=210994 RepID=A0A1U7GY67_9CYAN|nr:hypothetical protein NIES592_14640 [Fischerella major NIES-592]
MIHLVDTNFLLRFVDPNSNLNPIVRNVTKKLIDKGEQLTITSQNCIEFWALLNQDMNLQFTDM